MAFSSERDGQIIKIMQMATYTAEIYLLKEDFLY